MESRAIAFSELEKVSIIIVTYKGDDVLLDCLKSLKISCGDKPEIVVVDNSPAMATRDIVKRFANAIYVESPGNPGFAGGNNIAMPYCTRQYVLLLNNDTIVNSPDSIVSLVTFLSAHPKCGIAQGSILLPRIKGTAGGCGSYLTPFGFQFARGFGIPLDSPGLDKPTRCFSVIGAFMMFPRSLIHETGGFLFYDHFKSYYEESDFCHRTWLAGREVWYVPTTPIQHLCGHTSSMFAHIVIMRQYIRNSLFSLSVNLGWWGRLLIVSNYFLVMVAHSLVHLLRGDAAMFRADWSVFAEVFSLQSEIADARKRINRKISDFAFFKMAVRFPSLPYLLRSFRSNA